MDDKQKEVSALIRELKKEGLLLVWKTIPNKEMTDYRQRGFASTIKIVRYLPNSIKSTIYDSMLVADDKDDGLVYTPAGTRIHYTFFKRALEAFKVIYSANPHDKDKEHSITCY